MATSNATVPATQALLGWVHSVLNELRPFVEAPVFDHWLHHDKEGNAEDKVTVIANALQNLWDIRSPTHLITKDFGRRVDAFLDSVFFRRKGLEGDMDPNDSDFWRMVRQRSLLATPLANFMSAVNRGETHRYGQPTNLSDEVDLERRRFRTRWKGELLRVWNSPSTTASSTAAHSLLKPEIGHRVAKMHGTSKRRWEREARAF
ncbi:hypothetical protein OF846_003670 [Rhodotorula toruloides]|nr:hypothetical protein OF846_003670 [Rhodotorula toruloides]